MREPGAPGMATVRTAIAVYTAAFAAGTRISVRRGYVAEPFGLRTGLSPLADVVLGYGAGLAAPWPLLVVLWRLRAGVGRAGPPGERTHAQLAALAAVFMAGAAAEPISHRLFARQLPPAASVVAAVNLVVPLIILTSALAGLVNRPTDQRAEEVQR